MIGLQKLLVYSTLLLSSVYASPRHHHDDEITNWEKFSALLDSVDEGALHRVLHALAPKFKDGIFSRDRTAIEHVHSENPIIASKLVHIAKRQGSNSTATSTTSATTPEESTSAEQSSSAAASVSSAISSALSADITATTVPSPTSVLVAPTTPESATPIATRSGAVVYSTIGGGVVTLTSSAVSVRFTPSTSTHRYYTTLPDGSVSTMTSVVVVNAPQTETASNTGAAGAAATTDTAGLQSNADRVVTGGLIAALAGVVGFLAYL